MTEPTKPHLNLTQKTDLRMRATLLARVQTAQLLKMNEPEMAELIRQVETDPLFMKLLYPARRDCKVIRFQPHPRTRLSDSFFEINERSLPANMPTDVVGLLEERKDILKLIRRMGRETFERYFLRAEDNISVQELPAACGITEAEVKRVQDFLLAFSVRAEFFDVSTRTSVGGDTLPSGVMGRHITRLARLDVMADGEISFELMSPHLGRGRYDIQYDHFQALTKSATLTPEEKRHLKAFIRRLELINWRQNTLFRILDMLCHAQRYYLQTKDTLKKTVLSQRQMARHLSVAPSTVNRAIQDRSIVLPWEEEVLLEELFCLRKDLCLDVLGDGEIKDPHLMEKSDIKIQEYLRTSVGIVVPRRTVNTYRRLMEKAESDQKEHKDKEQ